MNKILIPFLLAVGVTLADDAPTMTAAIATKPSAKLTAIQAATDAERVAWQDASTKRTAAIKSAIARLKVSAASNQDIADILTLLKAINAELNQ